MFLFKCTGRCQPDKKQWWSSQPELKCRCWESPASSFRWPETLTLALINDTVIAEIYQRLVLLDANCILELSGSFYKAKFVYSIFPRHTLPNLDQIYVISKVLILNNDQHQNTISTNNKMNSKINQQHTPFLHGKPAHRNWVLKYLLKLFIINT